MKQVDTIAKKIIFIDIDGVLTNVEDGSSYLCGDPSTYRISERNLANLMLVLDSSPSTRVVVSSNWRRFDDNGKWSYCRFGSVYAFKNQLPKLRRMLSKWIIGDLTHERHLSKSEALELWFEDNPWASKIHGKYVIFEDEPEAEGFTAHPIFYKHTIKTSRDVGLAEEDAARALAFLK